MTDRELKIRWRAEGALSRRGAASGGYPLAISLRKWRMPKKKSEPRKVGVYFGGNLAEAVPLSDGADPFSAAKARALELLPGVIAAYRTAEAKRSADAERDAIRAELAKREAAARDSMCERALEWYRSPTTALRVQVSSALFEACEAYGAAVDERAEHWQTGAHRPELATSQAQEVRLEHAHEQIDLLVPCPPRLDGEGVLTVAGRLERYREMLKGAPSAPHEGAADHVAQARVHGGETPKGA